MKSLGVDIGKVRDPAQLVLVEDDLAEVREDGLVVLRQTRITSVPLRTQYPELANIVVKELRVTGADLGVVDMTGVGAAVLDMVRAKATVPVWGVTLTGGRKSRIDFAQRLVWMPKDMLIREVARMMALGLLKANHPTLLAELRDFEIRLTGHGRVKIGAKSGSHDDAVLAWFMGLFGHHLAKAPVHG